MKFLILILLSAICCFCVPFKAEAAEDQIVKVVEMAGKAIVNIRTEEFAKTNEDEQKPSPFKKYFKAEEDSEELVENFGSGVVLDPTGIIVTNEHLISKAITIRVKFVGGEGV